MWAVLTSPQITTPLPSPPQALRQRDELVVELELVGEALGPHAAVGEVDVEEVEVGELGVDDAALAVERRRAALGGDGERLLPRIGDDTAVPLLLGECSSRSGSRRGRACRR